MVFAFALIGAVVALIPLASFILIPMEVYLVYKIADRHNAFEFVPFLLVSAALVPISGVLKGLATMLQGFPVLGQIANSLVAFGFIMAIGSLAERYYSGRSKA